MIKNKTSLQKNKTLYKIFVILIIILGTKTTIYPQTIDKSIIKSIHSERNIKLDGIMKTISNSTYLILPAIPAGLFINYLQCDCEDKLFNSIEIGSAIVITGGLSLLLKEIIQRPRPFNKLDFAQNIGNESGFSMPSMHTSTAFSLATTLTLIEPKWYVALPAYLWATAVAYSRIHLGVHYFSDVIIGAIIGTGISFATNAVMKSLKK